ncbi:hypothetical protein, partial [Enterobacter cloacae complex sp. CH23B]|uniref:hypothetical protein n=1 Tax=Enterobacter cloacae complex sp. CH23B TaxID=2511986 RepID=UPI0010255EFF
IKDMIDAAKLGTKGGKWRGVEVHDKLLAPAWSSLRLGGSSGELVRKCNRVAGVLKWGEEVRYFKNSILHWSPWLSKVVDLPQTPYWIETARKLNNKGLKPHGHFWDSGKKSWKSIDLLLTQYQLNSLHVLLVHKVMEELNNLVMPICDMVFDWNA